MSFLKKEADFIFYILCGLGKYLLQKQKYPKAILGETIPSGPKLSIGNVGILSMSLHRVFV